MNTGYGNKYAGMLKRAVPMLVVVNLIMYLLQVTLGDWFTQMFMLIGGEVFVRPWIMLTSMFLHGSPMHLVFNMYVLFMFGQLLESTIGTKRFLFVYFVSGLVASFFSSFFYSAALGASGAIMGMMGVIIILLPQLRVLLFFIIPVPLWVAAILIAIIDLVGVFYPTGIGNIAHLVGLAVGLGYGYYLKQKHTVRHKKEEKGPHPPNESGIHRSKKDVEDFLISGRI